MNCNVLRECHIVLSKNKYHASLTACKEAAKHCMSHKCCICDMFKLFLLRCESEDNCLTPWQTICRETRSLSSVKQKIDWSAETTGGIPKTNVLDFHEKQKNEK